jgi:hypothetical protein
MKHKGMGVKLFSLFSFLTFTSGGFAQSLQDSEHASNAWVLGRKYDPWTSPGSASNAPITPGDSELGEQRILPKRQESQPFKLQLIESVMWTDNAALSDSGELSDILSNTQLNVATLPPLGPSTSGLISVGYSFFRYADNDSLDFDNLDTAIGINHVFSDLNDLSVWARYNYTRLLSAVDHNELFTSHASELGAYYPINQSAYVSVSSKFSLDANPSSAQRNEYGVMVGYRFSATNSLKLEGFYRIAALDYHEGGRDDLLQTVVLTASQKLTDSIDLVCTANYSTNDSNLIGRGYEAGGIAGIISLRMEF